MGAGRLQLTVLEPYARCPGLSICNFDPPPARETRLTVGYYLINAADLGQCGQYYRRAVGRNVFAQRRKERFRTVKVLEGNW